MSGGPHLSVVAPVHDEMETLPLFVERVSRTLDELVATWELIVVDDGSRDGTYPLAVELHGRDPRVKVIRLSRNFGHQVALSAGLDLASGDAVITMDGDLQHPPELIPEFVSAWRAGHEVVYGVMVERQGEGRFKSVTARVFYGLLGRLSDTSVPAAAGDFRLVDRKAVDAFRAMHESNRYLRGMFSWIGFRQIGVPYVSQPRVAGKSKYSTRRMMRLATDAIVGFSDRPLRLALDLGFVVSAVAIVFGISALVTRLTGGFSVPGWASIMVLVAFVGGIQLIVLGVVGEYIARIYDEVKRRPLYLVHALHGIEEPAEQ